MTDIQNGKMEILKRRKSGLIIFCEIFISQADAHLQEKFLCLNKLNDDSIENDSIESVRRKVPTLLFEVKTE